jgi:arylsulfatase A-like enzyme
MLRAAFASILTLLGSACSAADADGPRNLLIVCVDTLRADELGAYGAEPSITPALDALAREGIVFERAHAAASWTLPSVGALFTSLPPSATRLWTFESRLAAGFSTLAERFAAAGYATHGVASHVFFDAEYGLQQGFASFDDELCHRSGEVGHQKVTSPEVAAKAVRWLEQRARGADARPWLLFVHFFDPHLEYVDHEQGSQPEPPRSERERYRSEIAFTDRHVGRVLEALAASGAAETTNVLFFSDHGESFLEHPPIRRHSYSLYEEELRVPLVLRVPGLAPRRVPESVRTVDLLPTLLELHGLVDEPGVLRAGQSLVPVLRGAPHVGPPLLAEIRLKDGHHANALVRGRHKLIQDVSGGRLLLFDLERDPREREDLAAREPGLRDELAAALAEAIRAAALAGASVDAATPVEHDAEQLELLQKLGYAGEEEEGADRGGAEGAEGRGGKREEGGG